MNWKTKAIRNFLAGLAALALAAPVRASGAAWHEDLGKASRAAAQSGRPVLADFTAPWCYSCYYMEENVLSGAAFEGLSSRLVLLKLDVDTPEGARLKRKYAVGFLPSYLLLDSQGAVLGRILGEQTEADFLARLEALLRKAGGPEERAIESLGQRLASKEFEQAQGDIARLPGKLRGALGRRREWKDLTARLALRKAAAEGSAAGLASLDALFAGDPSCELAYDAYYAESILQKVPQKERRASLGRQRPVLEKLVETGVFGPKAGRCADGRAAVEVLAHVYEGLGLGAERSRLLGRAADFYASLAPEPGEDRNLDDNHRYFLHEAGRDAALEALYPRLIKAYPHDYVYAYRFAGFLEKKGELRRALKRAKEADRLAYGANRLAVTRLRARLLAALGKKKKASRILKRDIKWGRKAFPGSVRRSEKLLEELQGSSKK